jgi:hypothetical protein
MTSPRGANEGEMTSAQGANEFTLSVEFAGISLYVIDDTRGRDTRDVAVLMPTCLPSQSGHGRGRHEDETEGVRHVPYLLMDLANFDQQVTTPGLLADGPKFQVVRRLSREEIVFRLEDPEGGIKLAPDPLPLPDLSVYKPAIRLIPDVLSDNPSGVLNARTILKGGELAATTLGGPGKNNGGHGREWDKHDLDWNGSIKWTRKEIPGNSLTIEFRNWDTRQITPLTITPVKRANDTVIELKIAILCETNPLEWREFEPRFEKEDRDFKWLFRLFEAEGGSVLDAVRGRGREFPFPRINHGKPRTTGNAGCTGGQFGIP